MKKTKSIRVYQLYTRFNQTGGAQYVISLLHQYFSKEFDAKVIGFDPYPDLDKLYKNQFQEDVYIKFSVWNILKISRNSVFISHNRNITTLLVALKRTIKPSLKIIHVAHNEFSNRKNRIFYPSTIVAVSNRVKENLINFYRVRDEEIQVIHNGIPDHQQTSTHPNASEGELIKILYPARITMVKNQIELVKQLGSIIPANIQIHFAGDGPELDNLESSCKNRKQFKVLGHIDDILSLYKEYHYVMLFSKQEGLPIVLIEALMQGIPVICNDVGGNTEIVNEKNGFLVNDYKALNDLLSNLPDPASESYHLLAKEARNSYESKFDIEKMCNAYTHLIRKKLEH